MSGIAEARLKEERKAWRRDHPIVSADDALSALGWLPCFVVVKRALQPLYLL